MPWKRLSALAAALVLAGALSAQAIAQRWDNRDWIMLGERVVNFRAERDAINVTQSDDWYRDRGFRRLHLIAERSDIHLISVRLVYANGYWEDFPVDRLIRDGQDQPIELRGDKKYLRRIEMIYRSRPSFEGRAVMKVYGEPSRFAPPPAQLPPVGPSAGPSVPVRAMAPSGPSSAASAWRCSASITTPSASVAARAASSRSGCTCAVPTSTSST
jgi:hypothetical protein